MDLCVNPSLPCFFYSIIIPISSLLKFMLTTYGKDSQSIMLSYLPSDILYVLDCSILLILIDFSVSGIF